MENKMKKLIALFAVTSMASTAAVASIALSGTASVSYDDNGTAASSKSYDADLSVVGTAGSTTTTIGMDVNGASAAITSAVMATTIGPVTISADLHDEVSLATTTTGGGQNYESTDTSITVTLDVPIGDATIGLNDAGDVTMSGTFSGVTITHTGGSTDTTTGSASIAGMDISVTNKAGASTWSLATTVSGVDLTLTDAQKITAAFGLAGNTMTVTRIPAVASASNTLTAYPVTAVAKYSTVAISRTLTSGATLAATYSTKDDSLTLKASVAF
jgi:hypothetical protein